MFQITSLTDGSKQELTIPLEGGNLLNLYLYFLPTQNSWYFDFQYNDYICKGEKVVLTPNAIRHLRNILPFGIGFDADGNIEPYSITDFVTGRIKLFILNKDDVELVENVIYV